MTGYKAGLHKKISSIFDGVPVKKESADSACSKTSLPDFITEQSEVPRRSNIPLCRCRSSPLIHSAAKAGSKTL